MNIRNVIDRYFEGTSSTEDENLLRDYFLDSDNIDEDLKYLKPLFVYFNDESEALQILNEIKIDNVYGTTHRVKSIKLRRAIVSISSIAAILIIGVILFFGDIGSSKDYSYVWVNGEKITNPDIVYKYAEKSFESVVSNEDILEQQLLDFFE